MAAVHTDMSSVIVQFALIQVVSEWVLFFANPCE